MKLLHRFGYYLGGFSIGIIFLAFFLQGKRTSCDYGPNARTTKNISLKTKFYSEQAESMMLKYQMDTLDITNLIRYGDVNFSKSDTKSKPCKTYYIDNVFKDIPMNLLIENCDTAATILKISLLK